MTADRTFAFRFDSKYALILACAGIAPGTSSVRLRTDEFDVRFGPWALKTPLANIAEATVTGPYRWFKVIGPHLSMTDRGVTFGTTSTRGVCLRFLHPVPALEPFGVLRHPGVTVTVADPDGLVAALAQAGVSVGSVGSVA